MKKLLIILFLLSNLISYCQVTKPVLETKATSYSISSQNHISGLPAISISKAGHFISSVLPNARQKLSNEFAPEQFKTNAVRFKMDYLVLPLFSTTTSLLKSKFFSNWEPFVSVLLNRNIMYSSTGVMVPRLSSNLNVGLSFGAGLRLPLTKKLLFDIGLRDEFVGLSNRRIYLTDLFSKDTSTLGLTLGLSYKI